MTATNLVLQEARLLQDQFTELYGQNPRVYCAPGRVNLIGEHTDYNEGFVMPVAMDLYTWVAAAARKDAASTCIRKNVHERAEMDLQHLNLLVQRHWSAYVLEWQRVCDCRREKLVARICWWKAKLPIGAGLSSSASVEVAVGYALLESSGTFAQSRGAGEDLPARGK